MIGQRKPEGMPHKGHSNYHEGVAQRLSPSPPVCLSNMYFFFLLINTCLTTIYLRGNSFLQSGRARALVTDRWSRG